MNPKPVHPLATRTPAALVVAADDLALARSAVAGERSAIDEVMRRLSCVPRMVAAQNEELGRPLDTATQDDVVQEVMILVWKKLNEFEGRATLESWVFRIGQFEVWAQIRKRRRLTTLDDSALAATPAAPPHDVDVIALERITRLLAELPDESHRVIRMKHFDSLTFDEIAHRLGLSPNTAKTIYYRALLRLRTRFQDTDLAAMGAA